MESKIFQKKLKKIIGNKNIITNIYRIQAHNLIMCGHSCIGFIDFMLKGKYLLDYTNLFSPNKCEKNDNITLITKKVKMKWLYCVISGKYRKFEKHKTSNILENILVLSTIRSKYKYEDEQIFKEEKIENI